jgi:dolichol-phosphate mannosyltransferase
LIRFLRLTVSAVTLVRGVIATSVAYRLVRSVLAESSAAYSLPARSPICISSLGDTTEADISVVVPARNEADRIEPLLKALRSSPGVREVIVVDDESTDATADVAASLGASVIVGTSPPAGWAGKAWALQQGVSNSSGTWVVTFDADALPHPDLPSAAVDRARTDGIDLLTLAGRFARSSAGAGWLHPAMLTTLVYRFGAPGDSTAPSRVLANGQCMVFRRALFDETFRSVSGQVVEDVAWARQLAGDGSSVRFLDAGESLVVSMYDSFFDTWCGWGRSIGLPGVERRSRQLVDLAVLAVVLPLPLLRILIRRADTIDAFLLAIRFGVLVGTRRALLRPGVEFWLSPVADAPAWLALAVSSIRRRQVWRDRSYLISAPR